ncbi:MAG: response regulator [Verrucomicrobia bacterium]|jgi:signal transduction histidine kinase|nr:response regulator [Verrucomicrobiota bacterium]MBT7066544.1 response regulator [Verrucomicrobiota bacterium]
MTTVLVIDDEKSMRLTLSKFLQSDGYQAKTAESAEAAKVILQEYSVDVVVSDIILPGASGMELLQFIRQTLPQIQVIIMTGQPSIETAAETVRLAASDYLSKPVSKNALLRAVGNATRVKRLDDERRDLIVTLRTQYAALEELASKRTDLLHLLQHDIANTTTGAIAILESEKQSPEAYAAAEESLLAMLTHCEAVIRDVRDRQSESASAAVIEAANLRLMVEESCATLGTKACAKRVELRLHVGKGPSVLITPGSFVIHVLNNILSNAIKFSYSGGVIDIAATTDDAWVSLSFRDYGRGIPPDQLARLPDSPFSTPGTAGEPGTGYGLRHARKCVAELGGSIDITSTSEVPNAGVATDSGTTVTVRVKRAPDGPPGESTLCSENAPTEQRPQQASTVDTPGRNGNVWREDSGIIVIDDAWPVSDALCLALTNIVLDRSPTSRCRVTYGRAQPLPLEMREAMRNPNVEFVTLPQQGQGIDPAEQMKVATGEAAAHTTPLLILQSRPMISLFYDMLSDPDFAARIKEVFGVLAVDYALGQSFFGTDISRRVGRGMRRILISANAEAFLPEDYRDACEGRIDKSAVRMPTLAGLIADPDFPSRFESA